MVVSIEAEAFVKTQHPFMMKTSQQTRHRRELPQPDEGRLQTPQPAWGAGERWVLPPALGGGEVTDFSSSAMSAVLPVQ